MGYNPMDLEYEKVISSIDTTDQDYGVDVDSNNSILPIFVFIFAG